MWMCLKVKINDLTFVCHSSTYRFSYTLSRRLFVQLLFLAFCRRHERWYMWLDFVVCYCLCHFFNFIITSMFTIHYKVVRACNCLLFMTILNASGVTKCATGDDDSLGWKLVQILLTWSSALSWIVVFILNCRY